MRHYSDDAPSPAMHIFECLYNTVLSFMHRLLLLVNFLFSFFSFNRIDLPPYQSYHKLKESLKFSIENTEGFEGVD